jgi:hypothetical protein
MKKKGDKAPKEDVRQPKEDRQSDKVQDKKPRKYVSSLDCNYLSSLFYIGSF